MKKGFQIVKGVLWVEKGKFSFHKAFQQKEFNVMEIEFLIVKLVKGVGKGDFRLQNESAEMKKGISNCKRSLGGWKKDFLI